MEELAKEQFEKMRSLGIEVSPEDAVQLNDAARALRCAKQSDKSRVLPAPRLIACGGEFFHEPTVASTIWTIEIADVIAEDEETEFWLHAFSLVHAEERGFFSCPEMRDAVKVLEKVREFQRNFSGTMNELISAVFYCVVGEDMPVTPGEKEVEYIKSYSDSRRDRIYSDLAEAVGVTGSNLEDLKSLTPPMLDWAIRRAWEMHGSKFKEATSAGELVAYKRLCAEIAAKSTGNKSDNKDNGENQDRPNNNSLK